MRACMPFTRTTRVMTESRITRRLLLGFWVHHWPRVWDSWARIGWKNSVVPELAGWDAEPPPREREQNSGNIRNTRTYRLMGHECTGKTGFSYVNVSDISYWNCSLIGYRSNVSHGCTDQHLFFSLSLFLFPGLLVASVHEHSEGKISTFCTAEDQAGRQAGRHEPCATWAHTTFTKCNA